ncbi:uncharacterized protein LOC125062135 [Pieris napi]|uniref:uncharacterized protein LOC125062135 n=1 Tax=Pieris napi TaxID=78633 RepID=UPI001FB9BA39|nr:uncharacterized protein LOC125062135 [Pieris napi]
MDKNRSKFTAQAKDKSKGTTQRAKGDCFETKSSSHTQYYRKKNHAEAFERITIAEYCGKSESISGSSKSYHCVHGPEGKQYTEKGLLKRNLLKQLDPIPTERAWNDECPPALGKELIKMLVLLVSDPEIDHQMERFENHLRDFARTTCHGYYVDSLDEVCVILYFLVENIGKKQNLYEALTLLLRNMEKPIRLNASSDVITYFETLQKYFGFIGYLLIQLADDELFDIVSRALIWQLSTPDVKRHGAAQLRHTLAAAPLYLYQTLVRMLCLSSHHRYPTFLQAALLLAYDSTDNCLIMMKESIIENIFYRFNPYYPHRDLPEYDINPLNPQDINIKLGDSTIHISITISLLLILSKTLLDLLNQNRKQILLLPCPNEYAQRCFLWAFRYECRARDHKHERLTLAVIANTLLKCYGERLTLFASIFMSDILSLSVLTEVPTRHEWMRSVNLNTKQMDVEFKKTLICFSVDFIKTFKYSAFTIESEHWLLGLMYLIDPGLCCLRAKWSPALFAELRKVALQALVCTIPCMPSNLVRKYGLIRRLMWYIEWYAEVPYELPVLYWCTRVLQVSIQGDCLPRYESIHDLFETHGIIILMHLCYTLLSQKLPPIERSQVVIAVCLQLLTGAVKINESINCCVYPEIKWPISTGRLSQKMLDDVLYSLENNFIISDKWIVSIVDFIWEAIVWKKKYREYFIAHNGLYKLLDLITMTKPPIQCIALAVVCDIVRSGEAIGQLVTWRAAIGASNVSPNVVKRGSNIAGLLAAVFRNECLSTQVAINDLGVLQNLDYPILSTSLKEIMIEKINNAETLRTICPECCFIASDLAGSRLSKAYAILQLLSEDLSYKVNLADEAYNLYKNIQLSPEEETILVLCSHFLTIKLNECWFETKARSKRFLPQDEEAFEEFIQISNGWAKEIKRLQEDVITKDIHKDLRHESSLYDFLARVRLNIALDALREVRCVARSADRSQMVHAMLHDAVQAHHRRTKAARQLNTTVLRTFGPALDDQNITGQYVKVYSIFPKNKPKPKEDFSSA